MAGSERGPTREQMRRLLGLDLFGSVDFTYGLTCSFLQLKIYIWNHLKIERLIWHHVTKWTFGQVAHDNARACSDLCITLYCVYAIEGTLSLFFCLWKCFLTIHASVFVLLNYVGHDSSLLLAQGCTKLQSWGCANLPLLETQ